MRVHVALAVGLVSAIAFGQRTMMLDLGRMRSGTTEGGPTVVLPAPVASKSIRLVIDNQIPTAAYTVTVEQVNRSTGDKISIDAATLPAKPPTTHLPGHPATYSCSVLFTHPLGRVCLSPSDCVTSEREVADEVARILQSAKECGKGASQIEAGLRAHTRAEFPRSIPSPPEAHDLQVTVRRDGSAIQWVALVSACTGISQLETYLRARYPNDTLKVLAFDHQTETWSAHQWHGGQLEHTPLSTDFFKNSFSNEPRLLLPRGQEVAVVAVNTNPLLFSLQRTEATETDVESLATLKQLAELAGSALPPALATISRGPAIALLDFADDETAKIAIAREDAEVFLPRKNDPYARPREDSRQILVALTRSSQRWEEAGNRLTRLAGAVKKQVMRVEENTGRLTAYLQRVELADSTVTKLPPIRDFVAETDESFASLLKERNVTSELVPVCSSALADLDELFAKKLDGLPQRPSEQATALKRFTELLSGLIKTKPTAPGCEDVAEPIVRLAEWVGKLGAKTLATPPAPAEKELYTAFRRALERYADLIGAVRGKITAAGEILARRPAVDKLAASYQVILDRQERHYIANDICSLTHGVLEISRIEGTDLDLAWSKVRNEGFKVLLDPAYKDAVVLRHPVESAPKYQLQRKGWWNDLELDVALVHTDIVDPEFALGTREGTVGKKYVVLKDEKPRSGDLAMFMTYRRYAVSPQLGFGLESGEPAFFFGGSTDLGFIKLSGGITSQQVKVLSGGQAVDKDIVGDQLMTTNAFDEGWYVALAITINDLPVFKAPEK